MKKLLPVLFVLMAPAAAFADDAGTGWRPLLDAKLSQFDVYLSFPGTEIRDVIDRLESSNRAGD